MNIKASKISGLINSVRMTAFCGLGSVKYRACIKDASRNEVISGQKFSPYQNQNYLQSAPGCTTIISNLIFNPLTSLGEIGTGIYELAANNNHEWGWGLIVFGGVSMVISLIKNGIMLNKEVNSKLQLIMRSADDEGRRYGKGHFQLDAELQSLPANNIAKRLTEIAQEYPNLAAQALFGLGMSYSRPAGTSLRNTTAILGPERKAIIGELNNIGDIYSARLIGRFSFFMGSSIAYFVKQQVNANSLEHVLQEIGNISQMLAYVIQKNLRRSKA